MRRAGWSRALYSILDSAGPVRLKFKKNDFHNDLLEKLYPEGVPRDVPG